MNARWSPIRLVLVLLMIVLASGGAGAQTRAQPATLRVTVKDPSGAVIPGAAVQVVRIDAGTAAEADAAVTSDGQGVAQASGLVPGHYRLEVSFPGFEPHQTPDLRVRAGENRKESPWRSARSMRASRSAAIRKRAHPTRRAIASATS